MTNTVSLNSPPALPPKGHKSTHSLPNIPNTVAHSNLLNANLPPKPDFPALESPRPGRVIDLTEMAKPNERRVIDLTRNKTKSPVTGQKRSHSLSPPVANKVSAIPHGNSTSVYSPTRSGFQMPSTHPAMPAETKDRLARSTIEAELALAHKINTKLSAQLATERAAHDKTKTDARNRDRQAFDALEELYMEQAAHEQSRTMLHSMRHHINGLKTLATHGDQATLTSAMAEVHALRESAAALKVQAEIQMAADDELKRRLEMERTELAKEQSAHKGTRAVLARLRDASKEAEGEHKAEVAVLKGHIVEMSREMETLKRLVPPERLIELEFEGIQAQVTVKTKGKGKVAKEVKNGKGKKVMHRQNKLGEGAAMYGQE